MKKKVLFIIIPIILVLLILIAAIVGLIILIKNKDKSVGSKWGDTYYAYLKEATSEKDLKAAEEKYGMMLDMKEAKLQFCEVEENEDPTMIMTYQKNESQYVNVYQITEDDKVSYIAYKQPTEIEYLYNIEKDEYSWYVHTTETNKDSYSSLKNVVNNMKENSKKLDDNQNINIAELEADYTIDKENATITQKTEDGKELTISKFDEIFVKPEIEQNEQIDFDIDMTEKELKNSIKSAVKDYEKESKKITEEIKEAVNKKAEAAKEKTKQIKDLKKKEDMKITSENLQSKLGEHLKYFSGCYLGGLYGPYKIYKLNDVTGKVNVPDSKDQMVEEVVGLSSIQQLKDDMKKYMTEDVISRLTKERSDITKYMHDYNGKVYIVRGGIGEGNNIDWEKAKFISSEGDTTKVELEDYMSLGDYVEAKITVTLKYDEEKSAYLITDYSIKKLDDQTAQTTASTTTQVTKPTTPATNTTEQTQNKVPDKPTMANAISQDQALKLAQSVWGTKDKETGYEIGYSPAGWIKDGSGMQYYVFVIRWLVDGDHWSYLTTACIAADGKTYKQVATNKGWDNGTVVTQFDGDGKF